MQPRVSPLVALTTQRALGGRRQGGILRVLYKLRQAFVGAGAREAEGGGLPPSCVVRAELPFQ